MFCRLLVAAAWLLVMPTAGSEVIIVYQVVNTSDLYLYCTYIHVHQSINHKELTIKSVINYTKLNSNKI